jgi:hypothetical protein
VIRVEVAKRFELHRKVDVSGTSGTGVVAEGVQFRDGRVALRWLTATSSSAFYDSMDHVQAIHGHEGATAIVWIDDETSCACENPPPQLQENLADLSGMTSGVGGPARIAEAEVCNARECDIVHFLVRGDAISLVSTEQVQRRGGLARFREANNTHPRLPADIRIPRGFVLVHDSAGRILSKCDIYILRWHKGGRKRPHDADLAMARDYFGSDANLGSGKVEIPDGKWARVARVQLIRYRRPGFRKPFEHKYDPVVDLFMSERPLAWRLPLPEGCVVDSRGFVRP